MKLKQQASGWPSWVKTESDKDRFVEEYESHEGILLERDLITANPGLRSLAKLMLNSFWGKFGQRDNLCKTTHVHVDSAEDFFKILLDESKQIRNVEFPSPEIAELHWVDENNFTIPSYKSNVILAAYTTTHARLKLYSLLDLLGENVLYYDTDSVLYIYKPHKTPEVPIGDFLGDLTSELPPGNYISEFVAGGAKNYSYKLSFPDNSGMQYFCKVKGISLNFDASQHINFLSMKQLILADQEKIIKVTNPQQILRKKKTTEVITKKMTKSYRFDYDKRVNKQTFITYPYGF